MLASKWMAEMPPRGLRGCGSRAGRTGSVPRTGCSSLFQDCLLGLTSWAGAS